jgi:hypothetical protein
MTTHTSEGRTAEARTAEEPLARHAAALHTGFPRQDPEFTALRSVHHELLRDFLCVMDEAGRPGAHRQLGATILALTGQPVRQYWCTVLTDDAGHHRQVMIFDDSTHGWGDEISYSDRPRNDVDEMPAELLRTALDQILAANGLRWPDHAMTRYLPDEKPAEHESSGEYRRHRQVEYAAMMGVRLLCVAAAVAIAALHVPYAPVWIALLGLGMVFLPMCAVLEANDHHPRARRGHRRWLRAH